MKPWKFMEIPDVFPWVPRVQGPLDHCDPRFHSASLGPGGLTQLPGCYRGHGAVASGLQPADGTAMVEVADGRWLRSFFHFFPNQKSTFTQEIPTESLV